MIAKTGAVLALAMCITHAAAAPLAAGEYVTEGAWGALNIKRPIAGSQVFALSTRTLDGHACTAHGSIVEARATLLIPGQPQPCVIDFAPGAAGVNVKAGAACSALCDADVGMTGAYLRPEPACTRAAVRRARNVFLADYRRREYAQARARLQPVLERCARTLYYFDEANIRNDLAITYYHLGDRAACQRVLEPLRESAQSGDDRLRARLPQGTAQNYLRFVGHTRHNLALCEVKHKHKAKKAHKRRVSA